MHNNTPIVPYISLCSGYEGIGLGLHRCIPNLRCIAYCEREAYAIANLVAKMEKGLLDAAPVFTDVTTFPWEQFAPYMAGGILSFGWPCQPVSMAGKRKATEDERWLFDIIADGISILKPGMLFAENVEGLLSAKMPDGSLVFSHCIERLERLHYKVEAGIFSASEVGAPHQRKRVFIMAYRSDERLGCWETERWAISDWSKRAEIWNQPIGQGGISGELANSKCEGSQGGVFGREDTQREALDGYFGCSSSSCGVWPSRPGEQQYAWEPPRVTGAIPRKLADTNNAGWEARGHNAISIQGRQPHELAARESDKEPAGMAHTHSSRGEEPEHQQANLPSEPSGGNSEAMGNADYWRLASGINAGSGAEADRGGQGDFEQADGGTMGNSSQREDYGRESRDLGQEAGEGRCGDDAADGTSEAVGDPTNGRWRQCDSEIGSVSQPNEGCADTSECSETEFSMGDPVDESSAGVGISELSGLSHSELAEIREWMVKTDNRTDELRLLGNGCVPATVSRAFLTLLEKLTK